MENRNELFKVLKEEIDAYRQLLTISRQKGDSIINKKMETINTLQQKEGYYIDMIAKLEDRRSGQIAAICREEGISLEDGNASKLITLLGDAGEPLELLTDELREIIDEMKRVNEHNLQLLQQNIDLIQGTLTQVKKASESKRAYTAAGTRKTGSVLFDGKV